jgi:putative ABC transport system permease protein
MSRVSGPGRISRAAYRALLWLYPRRFRRRFGERMADDFARMYEELRRSRGLAGVARAWTRTLVDTLSAAVTEHRHAVADWTGPVRAGGAVAGTVMDVRVAIRGWVRRPGFAVVALVTLAMAIGANTTLFSVLRGVLLEPLPYPNADRLVLLTEARDPSNAASNVSYPNYRDWKALTTSFAEMGAIAFASATVTGGSEPFRVTLGRADPAFMRAAGLAPSLGRAFRPEENERGAAPVVVLSHALWVQSFGSDPDILGRTVGVNGAPCEVVGVLPAGADFAEADISVWIPIVPTIGNWVDRREVHALTVLARLKDGVPLAAARLELEPIGERLAREYPEANAGNGASAVPLSDVLLGDVRAGVWLLMGMVAVVLLIACANVANLLLVRFTARRRELALRRALGAGRWAVTRLFLVESLSLTLAGGALGVALAHLSIGPVTRLLEGRVPRIGEVSIDGGVLLFTLVLSLGTGIVFGLLPTLSGHGARELDGLRSEGDQRASGGRASTLARASLCTAQMAGSTLLLVGAGLLIRSFADLQAVSVGFDPDRLATMAVSLTGTGRSTEEVVQFYRELPALLEAIPGVRSASAVNALPISGGDSNGDVTIEGHPFAPEEVPTASFRRILPNYFATVGTPILYGRDFRDTDVGEPMVTIVNEAMARALWGNPSRAVGARIKIGSPDYEPWLAVVGVAGDVRNVGLDVEPRFATYEPHAQRPWTTMSVVVRTDVEPGAVTDAVRRRIRAAGGDIPIYGFTTLNQRIAESIRPRKTAMVLTVAFALLALAIAVVGLYGVLSYTVSLRSRELGVRMALGAGGGRIVRSVALQGAQLTAIGLGLGLVGAVVLGRVFDSALEGVRGQDAATFLAVPIVLTLVAVLASYVPARRAVSIDPAASLRQE